MSYWLTPYQEWFLWTQLACWFSWLSSKQEILIYQWNQCLINSNTSIALSVALKSSWCQLMAPQFVLSTTCSESNVNKVGIMTTLRFQFNSQHPVPRLAMLHHLTLSISATGEHPEYWTELHKAVLLHEQWLPMELSPGTRFLASLWRTGQHHLHRLSLHQGCVLHGNGLGQFLHGINQLMMAVSQRNQWVNGI